MTSSDVTGCLTFELVSDGSTTASGWDATITCGTPPSCPTPINLTLLGISEDQVTLSWTETGTAIQWEVVYQPSYNFV